MSQSTPLAQVESAVLDLAKSQPNLVAAFTGATSGIGEYTVRALAKAFGTEGAPRVYLLGRNTKAAETIIADCITACPKGQFTFIKVDDLSLVKDVDRACEQLKKEEAAVGNGADSKLDLLVMTQAFSPFMPRKRTSEGLDTHMAIMYYCRMRFVTNLLPLLLKSSTYGRVLSVCVAGAEQNLFLDDLSLRDPGHGTFFQARSHICYMKTIFFEHLAKRHPGKLSLSHIYPGLIITPAFSDPHIPTWFRILFTLLTPLTYFYKFLPEEVGSRIMFIATPNYPPCSTVAEDANVAIGTDGVKASGAYTIGRMGESIQPSKAYANIDKAELAKKGWEHTMQAFEEIEAGKEFTA